MKKVHETGTIMNRLFCTLHFIFLGLYINENNRTEKPEEFIV